MDKNRLKAFSLMEMTVVLGLTAIVMVMLSNVLVITVGISQRSIVRSVTREEVTSVIGAITNDINFADSIDSCGTGSGYCKIFTQGETYIWTTCNGSRKDQVVICKKDESGNILFASSDNLDIKLFTIQSGYESLQSQSRRNLLITVSADHVLTELGISNIVRQASASTRNYLLNTL